MEVDRISLLAELKEANTINEENQSIKKILKTKEEEIEILKKKLNGY